MLELWKAVIDFLKLTVVAVMQNGVLTEDDFFQKFYKAGSITGEIVLQGM